MHPQSVALLSIDVLARSDLAFPCSLPEFQRLFPDDVACAACHEAIRCPDGLACPHCVATGEPVRLATRPGVLVCRACRRQTGLMKGTVMERRHTPVTHFGRRFVFAAWRASLISVRLGGHLGAERRRWCWPLTRPVPSVWLTAAENTGWKFCQSEPKPRRFRRRK
jgi:hypothetical protein